MLRQF